MLLVVRVKLATRYALHICTDYSYPQIQKKGQIDRQTAMNDCVICLYYQYSLSLININEWSNITKYLQSDQVRERN